LPRTLYLNDSNTYYGLLPLLAGKGQDTATPFAWYLFMFQLTIGASVAGVIAPPGGTSWS